MEKMQELQAKLLLALEKEQKIYEEIKRAKSKDRSKLKRCLHQIKDIHNQMQQIGATKRQEIQDIVLPELWQERQLQSYLGCYQNQKSSYIITDITPRNNTTVEIQATTDTSGFLSQQNKPQDRIQNTIILTESENGLISYNEKREEEKNSTKATLKIKDSKKNKYLLQLSTNECNKTIITAKIDRWRYGLHFICEKFLNRTATPEDLLQMANQILNIEYASFVQKEYYYYLANKSNEFNLLQEISNYSKKRERQKEKSSL